MKAKNVAVLGGGSFGTVIANIIAQNGHNTLLWMRNAGQVESCQADTALCERRSYLGKLDQRHRSKNI